MVAAIVEIVATLGGGFYFMGKVTGRLDRQDERIKDIYRIFNTIQNDMATMRALITASAVHETRLSHLEAEIMNLTVDFRRLRRGVGWVQDAEARTVDREY